jgi:hypothetical protein
LVTLNGQAYAQGQFPEEDPCWDPNDDTWMVSGSMKEGEEKAMNIG